MSCGSTYQNMIYQQTEDLERNDIANAMCIAEKEKLRVRGTFFSPIFEMIDIRLYPCVNDSSNPNSTICATLEEMDNFFTAVNIIFFIYIDFSWFVSYQLLL